MSDKYHLKAEAGKYNLSFGAVSAELEIDAIIYRNEFEKFAKGYRANKLDADLILAFIFLQIYLECFLHQNMRRIIQFEFMHTCPEIFNDWILDENEKRYVPEKLDSFEARFFDVPSVGSRANILVIKDKFGNLSDLRNLFLHGHKVAEYFGQGGVSGKTRAKSLLTHSELDRAIVAANELGMSWNSLLDKVLQHCKALKEVKSFKFREFPKS